MQELYSILNQQAMPVIENKMLVGKITYKVFMNKIKNPNSTK